MRSVMVITIETLTKIICNADKGYVKAVKAVLKDMYSIGKLFSQLHC